MGGPVGNAAYAPEYVKAVVDKHKKRLKYIISLGAVDPQSALLLLAVRKLYARNVIAQAFTA